MSGSTGWCSTTPAWRNSARRCAQRAEVYIDAVCEALPSCRDPDDQKFFEAALAARADVLVTKDRELLRLARHRSRLPFRILTPTELRVVLSV